MQTYLYTHFDCEHDSKYMVGNIDNFSFCGAIFNWGTFDGHDYTIEKNEEQNNVVEPRFSYQWARFDAGPEINKDINNTKRCIKNWKEYITKWKVQFLLFFDEMKCQ